MGSDRLILMEQGEILCDIRIDDYEFKVTWGPSHRDFCVLWFRDQRIQREFEALGGFAHFDRRNVLEFVARYVTSAALREEISKRKFESHLDALPPTFFNYVRGLPDQLKAKAFRYLYEIDEMACSKDLARKRKILALRFHPDRGGSHESMTVINEAHDFLVEHVKQ
jgi:hypothetical protein